MKLKLRSIISAGKLSQERLTLRAETDLELGDFIVAQNGFIEDSPTTVLMHSFWFPYVEVERGDLVILYTKEGESRTKSLSTGKTAHFFYLGLSNSIWDDANNAAVVLHAPTWEAMTADELWK